MKDINRIKAVLAENKQTAKRLAEQLGKAPATASRWCSNHAQPPVETLDKTADALGVDRRNVD